ncbi:MAG: hypothetical protein JWQ38_467 [Flavipsychrobacter sp.]|nr:hypothetical protein [Flavipsychrobacter sp.]
METATAPASAKKNVHGLVNDRIIELLEGGIVPWRSPWADAGMPMSLISKRAFRGMNILLLASLGYEQNLFLTTKQLEGLNGSIKPGKKPHMIVFWGGEQQAGENIVPKPGKLQYYSVYNVSQCVGIPEETISSCIVQHPTGIQACEELVANVLNCAVIRHKEPDAFYDPLEDCINMPKLKSYAHPESYYSALFHQLAHSTGHHTRLDRMGLVQMPEYGCTRYTLEELVAEIVTNYLENLTGIPSLFIPDEEYIASWIQKLKADRYLIFTACAYAQKAIDFILNIQSTKEEGIQE